MGVGQPLYPKSARAEVVAEHANAVALDRARARAKAAVSEHRGEYDAVMGLAPYVYAEMRTGQSKLQVEIIKPARDVIEAEAWASDDGTETGGFLLGVEHAWGLLVLDATGPGPNAARDAGRVLLDAAHAERAAREHEFDVGGRWLMAYTPRGQGLLKRRRLAHNPKCR
jgi:hypothetical protein